MSKVVYKSDASYVSCRAGIYYYTRRVPYDVRQHYASNRLSFSLRTKSNAGALRAALSDLQHCFKNHRNKQTGLAFKVGLIEDKIAKCRNTVILLH